MANDPLDQFFAVSSTGELNFDKAVDTDDTDVTGTLPATEGGEDVSFNEMYAIDVHIPPNAKLSDVTKLALDAYKQQIEILRFIEPKFRNRGFEVAQTYLNLAQNSIKQDVELQQKSDRLILDREKANLGDKSEHKEETLNRDNLFKLVKGKSKVSQ